MNEELKPCPFCGGKASIRTVTPVHDSNYKAFGYGGYFVMCNECLTSSNNYNSEEAAAEHWNRRTNNEGMETLRTGVAIARPTDGRLAVS